MAALQAKNPNCRKSVSRRSWLLLIGIAATFALAGSANGFRAARARSVLPTRAAEWIWSGDARRERGPSAFWAARDFTLDAVPASAVLQVQADPEYVLWLNGRRIGAGRFAEGAPLDGYEVAPLLEVGTNRLLAELRSDHGTGGFLLSLTEGSLGRQLLVSDFSWTILRRDDPNLLRGFRPLEGGAPAYSWSFPPIGRWGAPRLGAVRPIRFERVTPVRIDPKATLALTGEVRHGSRGGRPDVRLLGGYFVFDSPDAALLVSLLPALVHVRGAERLSLLVRLVGEESSERRSGRDLVLTRLVEVLLIEALRSTPGENAPPGLLRGLADARLAAALRQMHGQLARSWTVAQLAKTAALSRSSFFERFTRTVGLPPMEYLLAWRMAVAKDLLRRQECGLAEVAERVGYGSASTFSTAFSRHVGRPPGRYARERSQRHTISP